MLGILIGVVAGGVAVMLYAPKTGPQTREILKDEVEKTQHMLQSWSNDIRQRVDEFGQILRFSSMQEAGSRGDGQQKCE
jgi:gas vesicle protein